VFLKTRLNQCLFMLVTGVILSMTAVFPHPVLAQSTIDMVFDPVPGGTITSLSWITRNETVEIAWAGNEYSLYNRKLGIKSRLGAVSPRQRLLTTNEYTALGVAKSELNSDYAPQYVSPNERYVVYTGPNGTALADRQTLQIVSVDTPYISGPDSLEAFWNPTSTTFIVLDTSIYDAIGSWGPFRLSSASLNTIQDLSKNLKLYDAFGLRAIEVENHGYFIQKVYGISDDGNRLLVGGTDVSNQDSLKLLLWDTTNSALSKSITNIEGTESVVHSRDFAASFMPGDEHRVFYVDGQGFVEYNIDTHAKTILVDRLRLDNPDPINHASFSLEGGWLVFDKGTVFIGSTLGVKAISCIADPTVFSTLLRQIKAEAYTQVIATVNAQRGQAIPTACADDMVTMVAYLQTYPVGVTIRLRNSPA